MTLTPLPEDWGRVLAIVAHPDDLEYGCASAMARWVEQGKTVLELIVTRGEAGISGMDPAQTAPMRTESQLEAARIIGAAGVDFLDYPDGTLEYGLPLRRDIARAVRKHRPDVVVSMNFHERFPGSASFNHPDHRVMGPAVLDGIRDAANPWVFRDLTEEGLDAWPGVRFAAFCASPKSRHFVDVTGHLSTAMKALHAHRSYLAAVAEPAEVEAFLTRVAEEVGREAGVTHGSLYELFTIA